TLLGYGVNLHDLPVPQQFEAFTTMAHLMTQPPAGTPRRLPRRWRPRCNALCRSGWPCWRRVVWDEINDRPRNNRWPNHGGMSTGPRTPEGRQRISVSNRQRARERRQVQALAQEQVEALAAYQRCRACGVDPYTGEGTS